MAEYLNAYGYPAVSYWNGQGTRSKCIHRILGITFLPNPDRKPEINHMDGNVLNNSLGNLEWVTRAENMKHAVETGLINNKGENHGMSKLTPTDITEIRGLLDDGDLLQREIGDLFGVTRSNISHIKCRKSWDHITWNGESIPVIGEVC